MSVVLLLRGVVGPHIFCYAEGSPGLGPSGIEGGMGDDLADEHIVVKMCKLGGKFTKDVAPSGLPDGVFRLPEIGVPPYRYLPKNSTSLAVSRSV